jgi:hypothetical protein
MWAAGAGFDFVCDIRALACACEFRVASHRFDVARCDAADKRVVGDAIWPTFIREMA